MDGDFDFQEWVLLAKGSPEAFELRRREAIDAFLATSTDAQRKLGRSLQREIDFEIRRAGCPQQAFSTIARMLRDQVDFLCEELEALSASLGQFDLLARAASPATATPAAPRSPGAGC